MTYRSSASEWVHLKRNQKSWQLWGSTQAAFCVTTSLHQFVRRAAHNSSQTVAPAASQGQQCRLWLRERVSGYQLPSIWDLPNTMAGVEKGQSRASPSLPIRSTTCLTFCPPDKGSSAAAVPATLPWARIREEVSLCCPYYEEDMRKKGCR